MRLVLATGNAHKIGEVSAILAGANIAAEVLPPSAVGGMPHVEEDAPSFVGNAAKKARALATKLSAGEWALADDSGLCVDALGGGPGVWSARFAGVGAGDAANNAKLLGLLRDVPPEKRTAAFRCCIVLVAADGTLHEFAGRCLGRIIDAPRGPGGFGYDPLFVPDGYDATFAELPADVKNRISHRAHALARLVAWLHAAT